MTTSVPRGEKMAERVAREVVEYIVSNELKPGTALPNEAELLDRYDIGRSSLREALRILEINGVITIRQGRNGPLVAAVSSERLGYMLTLYFRLSGATFGDLLEARLVIEPMVVRFAAERSEQADFRPILELLKKAASDDPTTGQVFSHGTEWHTKVAELSGNPILAMLCSAIRSSYSKRIGAMRPPTEQLLGEHTAITQAIIDGDQLRADELMREHMLEWFNEVQANFPGLLSEKVTWE